MIAKRLYTKREKYKEFDKHCVGINYVKWDDGKEGYIYFEKDISGNRAESFYKTLEEALVEYNNADEYFQKGSFRES